MLQQAYNESAVTADMRLQASMFAMVGMLWQVML